MKTKTIEKILRGKFAQFLKSIDDKAVQKLVKENSMITGGAIVSLVLNESVNDFDIYFTNRDTVMAVCKYYKELIRKNDANFETLQIHEEGDRIKFIIPSAGISRPKDNGKKFFPVIINVM